MTQVYAREAYGSRQKNHFIKRFDRSLDYVLKKVIKRAQVVESPKGNLVEIEDGHAAVSGDETCHNHCPEVIEGWEGARRPWR